MKNEIKLINDFKEWAKKNFAFYRGTVYYNDDFVKDSNRISSLPKSIISDDSNIKYGKKAFDTPFSHLIHILITIGRNLEREERKERIAERKRNITEK